MMRSLVVAVLVIGLSLVAIGGGLARWHTGQRLGLGADAIDSGDEPAIARPLYDFDPADDRALANYATDVFFGRVLGRAGTRGAPTSAPGQEVPQTQFAVEVMQVVKGDAAGVVTVNQVGGFDRQARQTMLLAGDALLRPGASELFLVAYVPARDWYQIVAAGHGHLSADDPGDRAALLARFALAAGETPDGAVFAPRAASATSLQAADEPVDFLTFNGAVYLSTVYLAENSAPPDAPIGADDLGPVVGQVVTNWVDDADAAAFPNEPCSWDAPDGTAPRLAPGDQLYAVRDYATTFRLAARQGDGFVAYQVWCNDEAAVGADLFDIYGRVERISVTEDLSEASGFAVIDDRATVASLVDMLLQGKVLAEDITSTAPITHQMIIHLDDGSTFRASAAPGEFLWGLGAVEIPLAFTDELQRAWERRDPGAIATPVASDG